MRVLTLNCNGIRAAERKGFFSWIQTTDSDIICLQEVRADADVLKQAKFDIEGYQRWDSIAEKKGYSGVSIYARLPVGAVAHQSTHPVLDNEGRWVQVETQGITIISLYLPSGTSGDEAQQKKENVMAWLMPRLITMSNSGKAFIVCGDINIAHTQKDIKNWRGNQKNSGFLPHERAWMSEWFANNWTDVFRNLNDEDEQYTWWSNRGNAWANNTGWRIDYQIATTDLAATASNPQIYKAERFSDHAPLIIDYAL